MTDSDKNLKPSLLNPRKLYSYYVKKSKEDGEVSLRQLRRVNQLIDKSKQIGREIDSLTDRYAVHLNRSFHKMADQSPEAAEKFFDKELKTKTDELEKLNLKIERENKKADELTKNFEKKLNKYALINMFSSLWIYGLVILDSYILEKSQSLKGFATNVPNDFYSTSVQIIIALFIATIIANKTKDFSGNFAPLHTRSRLFSSILWSSTGIFTSLIVLSGVKSSLVSFNLVCASLIVISWVAGKAVYK